MSWFVLFSAGGWQVVRVSFIFNSSWLGVCIDSLYFQLQGGWGVRVCWFCFSAGDRWSVRVGSDDTDGFVPVQDRRRCADCEV